jgi:hypothetical protein
MAAPCKSPSRPHRSTRAPMFLRNSNVAECTRLEATCIRHRWRRIRRRRLDEVLVPQDHLSPHTGRTGPSQSIQGSRLQRALTSPPVRPASRFQPRESQQPSTYAYVDPPLLLRPPLVAGYHAAISVRQACASCKSAHDPCQGSVEVSPVRLSCKPQFQQPVQGTTLRKLPRKGSSLSSKRT